MARKPDPKPLFPLKGDFYESLDRFIHEAGMLADVAEQAMKLGAISEKLRPIFQERIDAFRKARFGDQ